MFILRWRCLLLAVGLGISATASPDTAWASESITGCFPITLADAASFDPPNFERYPAAPTVNGSAKIDLTSHPMARRYRTMLRTQAKAGPNFAGHYVIAGWGCGSSCLQFAIIDAQDGRVYFPPRIRSVSGVHVDRAPDEPEPEFLGLRFHIDSRMLIIVGAQNDDPAQEGIGYYEWTGRELKRVRWLKSQKADCES
jgi:hypothetical protein